MNSANAADAFLEGFFGEGNDLSLQSLETQSPELAGWLEGRLDHLREQPSASHFLPRRNGETTRWYGLAHSARELAGLIEAIEAFIVPSYGRLDAGYSMDPTDPVDSTVQDYTGGHAVAFEEALGSERDVRRALDIFSSLEQKGPKRELLLARPLGRLLREFEMSVLTSSEDESQFLLSEIERSGQLSALNLVFLHIRRLDGLRQFKLLLELPELATVLLIRRPAKVTAALIRCVYVTELAPFEVRADPLGALKHFDVVLQKYPALFKARHGLQTAESIKAFMLHAVALYPKQRELKEQLLALPDLTNEDREYLQAIASLVEEESPRQRSLAEAESAIRQGQFDVAFLIASGQRPSLERAELLIRCACEIDSIEAMKVASDAVNNLNYDHRELLIISKWFSGPWKQIADSLSREAAVVPQSWGDWFQLVVDGAPFPNAVQIAERGVVEWSIAHFDLAEDERIVGLLNSELSEKSLRVIRDALPSFLQFLDRAGDLGQHRDLLDTIVVLLLAEEELGVADVHVVVDLSGTMVELGLPAGRYSQMIGDFLDLRNRVDSPRLLDAGLEMLDMLLTNPCPDLAARQLLFQGLISSFQRWRRRVREDQWLLLADFGEELDSKESVEALRGADGDASDDAELMTRSTLNGKKIAIYTLTEAAGMRARDFICRNFDGVVVELTNDHVASARLRTLARTVDIFVVATASAKHAATTFIESERPPDLPTLYAAGKGSASIIRAVCAHPVTG